ncbi:MAG TPA: hypothetical protein VNA57_04885 [Acidimicrobiales bacterium]|nr:hypothetical protein [Acidimicrobiales bacterium]
MTQLDRDLQDAIGRHFASRELREQLPALHRSYREDDYAEISGFLPEGLWALAAGELEEAFDKHARRRDLIVRQSGNTPRRYTNIDRDVLATNTTVIPEVFRSPELYDLLEQVVGERVLPVPYVPEEFIAARLHQAGDVHGWHWDDYTWALVWIFKMPDELNGGSLEYIKRVPWDQDDPRTDEIVASHPVTRRHPEVGNAYLLKADTALHRVSPLREDAERMIVCYSFATEDDLRREVNHESMEALYSESHARHYA